MRECVKSLTTNGHEMDTNEGLGAEVWDASEVIWPEERGGGGILGGNHGGRWWMARDGGGRLEQALFFAC